MRMNTLKYSIHIFKYIFIFRICKWKVPVEGGEPGVLYMDNRLLWPSQPTVGLNLSALSSGSLSLDGTKTGCPPSTESASQTYECSELYRSKQQQPTSYYVCPSPTAAPKSYYQMLELQQGGAWEKRWLRSILTVWLLSVQHNHDN